MQEFLHLCVHKARLNVVVSSTLTRCLLPAFLLTLVSCSSNPPPPAGSAVLHYEKGRPLSTLVQTLKATARVAGIDTAKRQVTLVVDDGTRFHVRVARGAVNFDQLRVGDRVTATLTQTLRVTLKNDETPLSSDYAADAPWAEANAEMIGIDQEARMITVRFENGEVDSFQVGEEVLNRHSVGDQLVFRTTDMVAIWIELAP